MLREHRLFQLTCQWKLGGGRCTWSDLVLRNKAAQLVYEGTSDLCHAVELENKVTENKKLGLQTFKSCRNNKTFSGVPTER